MDRLTKLIAENEDKEKASKEAQRTASEQAKARAAEMGSVLTRWNGDFIPHLYRAVGEVNESFRAKGSQVHLKITSTQDPGPRKVEISTTYAGQVRKASVKFGLSGLDIAASQEVTPFSSTTVTKQVRYPVAEFSAMGVIVDFLELVAGVAGPNSA